MKATRPVAHTVLRAVEKRIARVLVSTGTPATCDDKPDLGDDTEVAIQRSIDELGFMLRAPTTVLDSVSVFGLPRIVYSRVYRLRMDVIHAQYKDDIVDPWIRGLTEEGEKSLIGTIELSSKVAKDLVTSALERENNRYKRELEGKNKLVDQETVKHLIASYGNLVAAEEALRELLVRVKDLQERGGY
jgi:hypothetical protein